jgi:hypothetical protein
MQQLTEIEVEENVTELKVQSLKELKKSRRTMMMATGLTIPTSDTPGVMTAPLTPPLSERTSGDVEGFFVPGEVERYEDVDLSSDASWDEPPREEIPPTPEEVFSPEI